MGKDLILGRRKEEEINFSSSKFYLGTDAQLSRNHAKLCYGNLPGQTTIQPFTATTGTYIGELIAHCTPPP